MLSSEKNHETSGEITKNDVATQMIQLNIDYDIDNWHFQATPFGYIYNVKGKDTIKNPNFRDPYPTTDWWFRSLYFTYTWDKLSLGAGVLPFSNTAPTKFNDDFVEDGEGVLLINDSVLTAVFGIYKDGNYRTIFGIGSPDELIVDNGNYVDNHLREDGFSVFLINTFKEDKLEVTSQFIWNSVEYDGVKFLDNTNIGVNVSWDDSVDSGWSFYGSLAGSEYRSDARKAEKEIYNVVFKDNPYGMSGLQYGRLVESLYPENFGMDKQKLYGAASLLGFRKDFNIGKEDFFVNGEWTHMYGDYLSGSQGSFYTAKNNQVASIRDDAYYIQLGYIFNNDLRFRVSYTVVEIEETGIIGAPAATIPTSQTVRPEKVDKVETINFIMTYKF